MRAACVGAVLVVAGVAVNGVAFGALLTPDFVLAEAAFDASLAAFVVAPCALLEELAKRRQVDEVLWGWLVAIVAVASAGTAGAFLQSSYTGTVLRTGSMQDGLESLRTTADAMLGSPDLWALFVCIALVFAAVSGGRLIDLTPVRQTGVAVLTSVVPALVALPALGVAASGTFVSVMLLGFTAAVFPHLCTLSDRLSLRWGLLGPTQGSRRLPYKGPAQ